MFIALTGASGFIGSTIARHAAEHGHSIAALVRTNSTCDHIAPFIDRFVTGSQDDAGAIASLVEQADVVIHTSFDWSAVRNDDTTAHLNSNLSGAIHLLEASETRHFIYLSTIAVHHYMLEQCDGTIDESHPLRPGSNYGACKAAVEAHLWAAHAQRNQPVTSLRPCAVYGIDPNLSRSIGWPFIESVKKGEPITRKGGGKFVHVDDVASAAIASMNNPNTSPRVYNLVDCYARWADWASITAEIMEREIDIDMSAAKQPSNIFDTTLVTKELNVSMCRGIEGIRDHLKLLVSRNSE